MNDDQIKAWIFLTSIFCGFVSLAIYSFVKDMFYFALTLILFELPVLYETLRKISEFDQEMSSDD